MTCYTLENNRIRKHVTNFKTCPSLPFRVDVINVWFRTPQYKHKLLLQGMLS